MYFSFEESPAQIIRNMRSIGVNLAPYAKKDLLRFHSARPTMQGLEMHLVQMHKMIAEFQPAVVVLDPVSNLQSAGTLDDSTNMLVRLIDYLRLNQITGFFISLTGGGATLEATDEGLSSLVDTWLLVRDIELGGERNRALYVLKSRGMPHSNQVREFVISAKGVSLIPAYLGEAGVLTGSARLSQEARELAARTAAESEITRMKLALQHRQSAMEAQIESIRAGFRAETEEINRAFASEQARLEQLASDRARMASSRRASAQGQK